MDFAIQLPPQMLSSLVDASAAINAAQGLDETLAAVWPPGGVALAALLLAPRRQWRLILTVIFITGNAVNLWSGRPALLISLAAASSSSTVCVGLAWVLNRVLTSGAKVFKVSFSTGTSFMLQGAEAR